MPVPWIQWVKVHDLCLMATCFTFLFCWLLGLHLEIPVAKVLVQKGDPSSCYAAATHYEYPKTVSC